MFRCFVDFTRWRCVLLVSGWIYAVYSPVESVAFSGYFLHSFAISDQLSIYKLEQRLKVLPLLQLCYVTNFICLYTYLLSQ